MAAMPGDPDLSNYLMCRLHTHNVHTLVAVESEPCPEEHYSTGRRLVPWYLFLRPLLLIPPILELELQLL